MNEPVIAPAYAPWILKKYQYFTLLLNSNNQRYLGRSYAWLNRPGEMQRLSEITDEESSELRLIMRDYEAAVARLWSPDHMNYLWLGNEFHNHKGHGHMHFVPRYESPRQYQQVTFTDENWGKNYVPHTQFSLSRTVLVAIRKALYHTLVRVES